MPNDSEHRANRLIAALPEAAYARLAPHLELMTLKPRESLFEAGTALGSVYFPHAGVVCLMAELSDGTAETAAVGREGCIGFELALGGKRATNRALVQLPGTASRITTGALLAAMHDVPQIRELLLSYVRFFLVQALQSVACNSLHAVEERCARWLLMAHDRADNTDTLYLTQEFLAEVLGVHRPSVTIVARTLQTAGLIRYSRGVITITDRKGLEDASCDCYQIVRRELDDILPR